MRWLDGILGSITPNTGGGILDGMSRGQAGAPNTNGFIGASSPMSGWDMATLITSALSDAYAAYRGRPGDTLDSNLNAIHARGIQQQLLGGLTSTDPAVRQKAYQAAAIYGMDPSQFQKAQASAAMPKLLANLQPQFNPVNVTPQITGAGQQQARQAAGMYNTPLMSQPSLPRALATTGVPELTAQLAPQIIKQQMAQQAQANAPFDLSAGQHRFVNGKEVASLPEKSNPNQPFNADGTPNLTYQAYDRNKRIADANVSFGNSPNSIMMPILRKLQAGQPLTAGEQAILQTQKPNAVVPDQPGEKAPGTFGTTTIDTSVPGYGTDIVPGTGGLTRALLDQGGLEFAATGALPRSMGIGSSGLGGLRKNAIMNRGAELAQNGNVVANAAQVKATGSALTKLTTARSQITTNLQNAENAGALVINTFKGKVNTGLPLKNIIANAILYQVDPGQIAPLRAGLQEVANDYSNVFSRGGQVTDQVRSRSQAIANGDISLDALQKVFGQLNAQGKIVVGGYDDQIAGLQSQLRGIVSGAKSIGPQHSTPSPNSGPVSPQSLPRLNTKTGQTKTGVKFQILGQ